MTRADVRSWLIDMDGVLVREERAIAGADRFLQSSRRIELQSSTLRAPRM
jgi:NagD protein